VCAAGFKPLEVPVPQKGASSPDVILGSVTFLKVGEHDKPPRLSASQPTN